MILLGLSFFSFNTINSKDGKRILELSHNGEPDYQVAVKFMNDYINFLNERHSEIGLVEWINNRQDVSSGFKAELNRVLIEAEKEDPELGLGFDPILDAQDYPEKFEIDKKESEYIILKAVDWPEFRLTLKMNSEENKWLVDGSGIINVPKDKRIKR